MSKTPGAKHVTQASFAKTRVMQTSSTSSVDDIREHVGHGKSTQHKIAQAATWERWQELHRAHLLKAKAKRTTEKLAVKKQIIERNTKRKAVKIAVKATVDASATNALEVKLTSLSKTVKRLEARIVELESFTTENEGLTDHELLERNTPVFDDAVLADHAHTARRSWFSRRAK